MQFLHDVLAVDSIVTHFIVKVIQFPNIGKHLTIAAYRTVSMIIAQAHIAELKTSLSSNEYNFENIRLAIQILTSNRNCVADSRDLSTSAQGTQKAISCLFLIRIIYCN